ncbi:MAG: Gfo/Idh/MocA family protein [Verrucomicrobiales bacterium]
MKTVKVGIVGGGLMGREMASAFARWCALEDIDVRPELVAVSDLNESVLAWFERIPTVQLKTTDYRELMARPDIDVVYVAVPHHLHEGLYCDVMRAGKDLFAEKPFGIDLAAARKIVATVAETGRFCRCSSEFPFLPGAQRAFAMAKSGGLGRLLEVRCGLNHSSDLDPDKPANWKRLNRTCGEIGVMGDLGMHVLHLPLRLGWKPKSVHAQLQRGFPERPNPDGTKTACDTWDNAALHTWIEAHGQNIPMTLEMKRLSPGDTNSWFFEALGTEGGVRYSTRDPKALWTFRRDKDQWWQRTDLGFGMLFKTITGSIFEVGFPDILQQMWAAFLLDREGSLNGRFGCVTPEEALASHEVWAAALRSQSDGTVEGVGRR